MVKKLALPAVGALFAIASLILVACGNPGNMGLCVACFLRDTAGALGLHGAEAVQYARPEIIGIVLGAMIVSLITREFSSKGGSAPITRFVLGACVMVGALIFLGCPTRMVLRIAGGDLNAIVGLFGFAAGIFGGIFFLNKGFTLKRTYTISKTDGFALPVMSLLLLVALLFFPMLLNFSEAGPGAMRAPIFLALGIGLVMGGVGFISRLCFVAGIRDSAFFKNFSMLFAFVALLVVATVGNIIMGNFNLGLEGHPVAHTDGLWNFLGLALVGLGSVLLGGCPFRQVVLAGGGNTDSVTAVFGMIFGAALAHNLSLASSAAGVSERGPVGFAVAAVLMVGIAVYNTFFNKDKKAGKV
ncbi:MAG: YedE family putative selenium transporter [Defluviitaleaceae bacterium]|nr:YedE family putative selenium transporter [Defluviitaleaceae bacterium]